MAERGTRSEDRPDASGAVLGPVERQVRADVGALVSTHPLGEALSELAFRLAAILDADPSVMAVPGIARELREALLELARTAVNDDDDLDARLSRPELPAAVRDAAKR